MLSPAVSVFWSSWFRHQRSAVWILSSAKFIFTFVYCQLNLKRQKLIKRGLDSKYFVTFSAAESIHSSFAELIYQTQSQKYYFSFFHRMQASNPGKSFSSYFKLLHFDVLSYLAPASSSSVWADKNRQMSIKVAQSAKNRQLWSHW